MNPILCCLCLLLGCTTSLLAQVVITELQPAPAGSEPEWVEIENLGEKAVTITGWQICDDRSCAEIPSARLSALQRAILTRDATVLRQVRPLPDDVRVIEVAIPTLNNTTDVVVLRMPDGSRLDSVSYDLARHPVPRSLERVGELVDGAAAAYMDRWVASVDRTGATPGRMNSVITMGTDVGIDALEGADDAVCVRLVHRGRQRSIDVPVVIQLDDQRIEHTVPVIEVGQEQKLCVRLQDMGWPQLQGIVGLTVWIGRSDDRPENDTLSALLHLPPKPGTVVFNEILFDPPSGMDDYVEVVNTGSDTLDLSGWILADGGGSSSPIASASLLLPHGYLVLANDRSVVDIMDSGVPSVLLSGVNFNSTGDRVVLRTPSGFRVDEFTYSPSWHTEFLQTVKGRSLEKRSPSLVSDRASSWTTSTDARGGTPGSPNAVSRSVPLAGSLTIAPTPFSSDVRSVRHPAVIAFEQPFAGAVARLVIVTTDGHPVAEILDGAYVGSSGGAVWDGRDRDGARVRPGPYVVVLECVDVASSAVHHAAAVIVVGD